MDPTDESPAALFQRTLHVDRTLAEALEAEGFTCLDEVAYVPFNELIQVSGLTDEAATSLRNLARMYLLNESFRNLPPGSGDVDA
jgi:N utilization substance protein A